LTTQTGDLLRLPNLMVRIEIPNHRGRSFVDHNLIAVLNYKASGITERDRCDDLLPHLVLYYVQYVFRSHEVNLVASKYDPEK
ncbi:hypothetical protein, partial [Vibrio anguillarum]